MGFDLERYQPQHVRKHVTALRTLVEHGRDNVEAIFPGFAERFTGPQAIASYLHIAAARDVAAFLITSTKDGDSKPIGTAEITPNVALQPKNEPDEYVRGTHIRYWLEQDTANDTVHSAVGKRLLNYAAYTFIEKIGRHLDGDAMEAQPDEAFGPYYASRILSLVDPSQPNHQIGVTSRLEAHGEPSMFTVLEGPSVADTQHPQQLYYKQFDLDTPKA